MHARRAFTLVELLVVIVIVAILVALLIPAVQSAREAGRRITCANHMKQFALAVANYTSRHGDRLPPVVVQFYDRSGRRVLPKGWVCDDWGQRHSHGWRVAVLPFLEEQNLYDMFDFSVGAMTETNLPAISRVLPTFQCPSTPGYPRSYFPPPTSAITATIPDDLRVGAWDYGVPGDYGNSEFEVNFTAAWYGLKNRDGRFNRRSAKDPCHWAKEFGPAKLAWVVDGLSKTTVAYEYAKRGTSSGISPPAPTGWSQMWHHRVVGFGGINEARWAGRISFHPGGVNNAFLDGSVRFLDESMPRHMLLNLDWRNDGITDHFDPAFDF